MSMFPLPSGQSSYRLGSIMLPEDEVWTGKYYAQIMAHFRVLACAWNQDKSRLMYVGLHQAFDPIILDEVTAIPKYDITIHNIPPLPLEITFTRLP